MKLCYRSRRVLKDCFGQQLIYDAFHYSYQYISSSVNCSLINLKIPLFRQNTYLRNKKHTLTCQGGNWLFIKLLTTRPVVSWRGWETPPPSSIIAQLSFFAQPRLGEQPLSLCGLPSFTFCLHLVDDWFLRHWRKWVLFSFYSFC